MAEEEPNFKTEFGFCCDCGSILPIRPMKNGVQCWGCKKKHYASAFGQMTMSCTIPFNEVTFKNANDISKPEEDDAEGPVVDRRCPQCQHDQMSYSTLQLRSADEGQTVFYTCVKCKFKETENS